MSSNVSPTPTTQPLVPLSVPSPRYFKTTNIKWLINFDRVEQPATITHPVRQYCSFGTFLWATIHVKFVLDIHVRRRVSVWYSEQSVMLMHFIRVQMFRPRKTPNHNVMAIIYFSEMTYYITRRRRKASTYRKMSRRYNVL